MKKYFLFLGIFLNKCLTINKEIMKKQYLISFEHDSKRLGYDGFGQILITANSFEEACTKVSQWGIELSNSATGYKWTERFINARDFINLTIE